MLAIAVGEMGLSLESFLSLTPFEFQEAYMCFLKRQINDREWEYLKSMRVARWQIWRTLCPPKSKQISLMDLVELPGDKEALEQLKDTKEVSTQERFEELNKKWSNER
ncbi:hypothetical protein BZG01_00220 [Labilibaculum manganireducens]|uniref:Uncharacterized protein n=1 Tax=Labilibaculum manganireducens TaxID=1940525 RepID=A0A2N3IGK3_9BACT|nr:hypothetical protein [Labilibaculum manganireducens]PKQ69398.1 hypothetical protein BZG01_00220 [Labilibaculum manganireducens]